MKNILKTSTVVHFASCFALVAVVALVLFGVVEASKSAAIVVSFVIALVASVGYECYNVAIRKTGVDWEGVSADLIGAVLASLFALGM